jgi:hypothetical protein
MSSWKKSESSKHQAPLLGACLTYSSTMKMEAVHSSEIWVNFYQTTWHVLEGGRIWSWTDIRYSHIFLDWPRKTVRKLPAYLVLWTGFKLERHKYKAGVLTHMLQHLVWPFALLVLIWLTFAEISWYMIEFLVMNGMIEEPSVHNFLAWKNFLLKSTVYLPWNSVHLGTWLKPLLYRYLCTYHQSIQDYHCPSCSRTQPRVNNKWIRPEPNAWSKE